MKIKKHVFLIYFIGLLLSSYLGISEEYIVVLFGLLFFIRGKFSFSKISVKDPILLIFVLYYFFTTIVGAFIGYTEYKSIVTFVITFMLLPLSIKYLISFSSDYGISALVDFRNFVLVAASFGTIEWLIRYNPIYQIMNIPAAEWIVNMNNTFGVYQPSSFFLHYTYYASILLMGLTINLTVPYKSRIINIIAFTLMSVQLFVAQSRICWIAYVVLLVIYPVHSGKISINKISNRFAGALGFIALLFTVAVIFRPDFFNSILTTVTKRFESLIIYGFEDGSFGQRVGTMLNLPVYWRQNVIKGIFGSGYSSIGRVFLEEFSYFKGYITADCQYVTWVVETGAVGLIILALGIFSFVHRCSDKSTPIGLFGILSISMYAIQCVTYDITTYFIIVPLFLTMVLMSNNRGKRVIYKQIPKSVRLEVPQ